MWLGSPPQVQAQTGGTVPYTQFYSPFREEVAEELLQGLIADIFGVHAAVYTSQPFFAPFDEGGTRLLNPQQESLTMLGQAYGRVKILDQEIRGGRQLVDTPLINPQDSRMVPNTFEGATLVSLPDPKREL